MKSAIRNSELARISIGAIRLGLLALAAGALFNPARAAQVHETADEWLGSGDFDGDGRTDVLVVDKRTGNARVALQNVGGTIDWAPPMATGADPVSALAVGRFAQTNRDAIAVSGAGLNRIHILNLSHPTNTPVVLNPPHPEVAFLVGLDAPYGTNDFRSWLDVGSHDPGITLLDLLGFVADSLTAFEDQVAADGYMDSASSFRRTTSDATLIAAMLRGGSNDTFVAYAYTNTVSPVLQRPNLATGTEYAFGTFNNEPLPRLLFYVPGQSNIVVQALTNTGSGFAFAEAELSTFSSPVDDVYYVDEGTNGLAVVRFGDGVRGMRPSSGTGQLQLAYSFSAGASGNVVRGVVPFGTGKFVLLSGASNLLASTYAQVFARDGSGNYVQTSSNTLSVLTTSATRGNVWLFPLEPFVSANAPMIASLNAAAWSSLPSGLPGMLSVQSETDGGPASGLGNRSTNNFGSPPAGTAYALPNQYRDDISIFSYSPVQTPAPSVVTITPPPGSYTGPIQISFTKLDSSDDVYFRENPASAWQLYGGSFALTNNATIEYYGSTLSGDRGRSQSATYTLASTTTPLESRLICRAAEQMRHRT